MRNGKPLVFLCDFELCCVAPVSDNLGISAVGRNLIKDSGCWGHENAADGANIVIVKGVRRAVLGLITTGAANPMVAVVIGIDGVVGMRNLCGFIFDFAHAAKLAGNGIKAGHGAGCRGGFGDPNMITIRTSHECSQNQKATDHQVYYLFHFLSPKIKMTFVFTDID